MGVIVGGFFFFFFLCLSQILKGVVAWMEIEQQLRPTTGFLGMCTALKRQREVVLFKHLCDCDQQLKMLIAEVHKN